VNADIIRSWFEAANRRDFGAVMDLYADDVELVAPAEWLTGGVFSGKEAVGLWFGDWYRTFDGGPHFEMGEARESGEHVALSAHAVSRGGRSGVELDADYFYVIRVRDGKIAHIRFYETWDAALEAL
jgi:ketosteroid isomerase-like protein